MLRPILTALLIAPTSVLAAAHASARPAGDGPWTLSPGTELLASDPVKSDMLGTSVATQGNLAVVGAPRHDHGGVTNNGAAYVYRRTTNGWILEAELLPDVTGRLEFGNAVALDGGTIAVGSHRDDGMCPGKSFCDSGAVYVFVLGATGWVQEAKLSPSDLEEADLFGCAVRIQGDTIVAGSIGDRDAGSGTGSAYVFSRSGGVWTESQKLMASDFAWRTEFGSALSLDGDVLVIGARLDDQGSGSSLDYGAAYVFRDVAGVWTEEAKLIASDFFSDMRLGTSVSVHGDAIVLGGPGANAPNNETGAAYVFEYDSASWSETAKVNAPGSYQYDHFGQSVSMHGDAFVVGKSPILSGGGSAHAFRRHGSGWSEFLTVVSEDLIPSDQFGHALSLSAESLLVGAIGHRHAGGPVLSGSAYVFRRLDVFENYCDALPNSSGLPASITGTGTSSLASNDLVLKTSDMPANKSALLLYAANQAHTPFGDGVLCISGPFYRMVPPGKSDTGGVFVRFCDNSEPPMSSGPGAITAGSTWNFQCWFRDTTAGGFNLSNGLRVLFVP